MLSGERNDAGSDPAKAGKVTLHALAISRETLAPLDARERKTLMVLLNKLRRKFRKWAKAHLRRAHHLTFRLEWWARLRFAHPTFFFAQLNAYDWRSNEARNALGNPGLAIKQPLGHQVTEVHPPAVRRRFIGNVT